MLKILALKKVYLLITIIVMKKITEFKQQIKTEYEQLLLKQSQEYKEELEKNKNEYKNEYREEFEKRK